MWYNNIKDSNDANQEHNLKQIETGCGLFINPMVKIIKKILLRATLFFFFFENSGIPPPVSFIETKA